MNTRVVIKSYYDSKKEKQFKEVRGVFQQWGETILFYDEKHFSITVAIVLGDDGNVYIAPPEAMSISE